MPLSPSSTLFPYTTLFRSDVGMPERDGYEVAAYIKGTPELAHIPVLLLTGAFEPIDETRARAVGCDGVLVKPFEPQIDRKSTRLNSSHSQISYAVFCLKKK